MKDDLFISVIIPVHNISAYIRECVSSVIKSISNFKYELLLINNGSSDNSYELCNILSEEYDFIRVFNMDKSGVSSARNFGIDNAKGNIIAFIDGDDCVTENYFKHLILLMENGKYDFVSIGHTEIYPNGKLRKKGMETDSYQALSKENILHDFYVTHKMGWNVWGKLFKKKLIENIRFDEKLRNGEDMFFIYQVSTKANSFAYKGFNDYLYRMRSSSASNLNNLETRFEIFNYFDLIFEQNLSSECEYFYLFYYLYSLELFCLFDKKGKLKKDINLRIKKIRTSKFYSKKFLPLKYKLELCLLKVGIPVYKLAIHLYSPYYFAKRKKE